MFNPWFKDSKKAQIKVPCFSDDIVKTLEAAMRHWDVNTCIKFQKRTSQPDYISFHNGVK